MSYDFDLIVLGSGPAGQKAAIQAAKAGKKVALIEPYAELGGGCLHVGTIPSKSFRESVYRWSLSSKGTMVRAFRKSRKHAAAEKTAEIALRQIPEMKRLLERKERVVETEAAKISETFLRNHVAVLQGWGSFLSAHEIEILPAIENGKPDSSKAAYKKTAEKIFIATGARPVPPQGVKIDGLRILDSDTILGLKDLPKSLIVLGAGIIGCEFASMFQTAGTQVHLVDKRPEILASVDREIVAHLVKMFTTLGMSLHLAVEAKKIEVLEQGVRVELTSGEVLEAEGCLVAQGRQGNTEKLQLEKAGIEADGRGLLKVNPSFQTSIPNIYAIGDVIGFPALASTSMGQGRIAACSAFELTDSCDMPGLYPYGIYTIPEISTIGKTEEELKNQAIPYFKGVAEYREIARGQIVGDQWGVLKLLVHRETRAILGVHILGDSAADLIHIGQAVMALGGTLDYFITTVFNYPTLAEAYKTAALTAQNVYLGRV